MKVLPSIRYIKLLIFHLYDSLDQNDIGSIWHVSSRYHHKYWCHFSIMGEDVHFPRLNAVWVILTHKCDVLQDDLSLVREDVKPDHMSIVVSVDNLRFW